MHPPISQLLLFMLQGAETWIWAAIGTMCAFTALISAGVGVFVKITIENAISKLFIQVRDEFVAKGDCKEKREGYQDLYKYAHNNIHALRNVDQAIAMSMEKAGIKVELPRSQ